LWPCSAIRTRIRDRTHNKGRIGSVIVRNKAIIRCKVEFALWSAGISNGSYSPARH
jgi:hypothetical protein